MPVSGWGWAAAGPNGLQSRDHTCVLARVQHILPAAACRGGASTGRAVGVIADSRGHCAGKPPRPARISVNEVHCEAPRNLPPQKLVHGRGICDLE